METQTTPPVTQTALINALYRWHDDLRDAQRQGQHLLAFFIGLAIDEAKALLNVVAEA